MRLIVALLFTINLIFGYEIYVDKNSQLKIEDILSGKYEFENKDVTLKYSNSTLWLKRDIENKSEKSVTKYIVFTFIVLDNIEMYYQDNQGFVHKKVGGTQILIDQRDIKNRKVGFKVDIPPHKAQTLYFKINTSYVLNYDNIVFDTLDEMYSYLNSIDNRFYAAISVMSVIFIIMLLIYFFLRDKVYLYYLFFLGISLLAQLYLSDELANYFIIPNSAVMISVLLNFTNIIALVFLSTVLDLKNNATRLAKGINVVVGFVFLETIYVVISKNILIITPFLMLGLLMITGYALYKKIKYSKFVMVGWLFFLSPILYNSIMGNFISNHQTFRLDVLQFAFILESLVFITLLGYRAKEINDKHIQTQREVLIQSRFATIGEALSNIEHQWRIPLNRISAIVTEIYSKLKFDKSQSKEEMLLHLDTIDNHLQYMSETMADFRNFYVHEKNKEHFNITKQIEYVLKIFDYYIEKNKIKVTHNKNIDIDYIGYGKEFAQVILNLLSNSKNAFNTNSTKNPEINISQVETKNSIEIYYSDNGGGIENLDNIFNKFNSSSSSGIGLNMSKKIIEERLNGKLELENKDNGLFVKIILPKE